MQQNLARQYATNFGKRSAKDPSSHHLIQNTESVLVTTTMDLISPRPRGDGVSRSADDAVAEPRGFFADQFEVSFSWLVPPLYAPPARSCGFSVELFTSYDWERARDSVDQRRLRDSPWPIYPGPHTSYFRPLPPTDIFYVHGAQPCCGFPLIRHGTSVPSLI